MIYIKRFCFLFVLVAQVLLAQGPQPTVAVIGAGLAGLTAGYRLQKAGYQVDIYEARARPGGRVFTMINGNSHEELGGKWISDGGDGKNFIALAKELGLEIEDCSVEYSKSCLYNGQVVACHPIFLKCPPPSDALYASLKEKAQTAKSLAEVLDQIFIDDPFLRHIVELRMRNYEGCATADLSPFYLDSFWEFYQKVYSCGQKEQCGETDIYQSTTVKGGNYLLVQALSNALNERIHFYSPLVKISKKGNRLRLAFDHQKPVVADYVLLAIPCSTLKDVKIAKGIIPHDQWQAISTLQYGSTSKILVPIKNLGEHAEFAYTNEGVAWFNADHTIMTCYYGGPAGLFSSAQERLQEETPAIQALFPGILLEDTGILAEPETPYVHSTKAIGINWTAEKYSKGGYSSFGVGQDAFLLRQDDLGQSVRSVFRSIEGKIFFAGEHTALDFPATMEGAVESGERAAQMMQRSISRAILTDVQL